MQPHADFQQHTYARVVACVAESCMQLQCTRPMGQPFGAHHYCNNCKALHGAIQRATPAGLILISPPERSGAPFWLRVSSSQI